MVLIPPMTYRVAMCQECDISFQCIRRNVLTGKDYLICEKCHQKRVDQAYEFLYERLKLYLLLNNILEVNQKLRSLNGMDISKRQTS